MSEASCPVSGHKAGVGSVCPAGNQRVGPRGCAFAAYQMSTQSQYTPQGVSNDVPTWEIEY